MAGALRVAKAILRREGREVPWYLADDAPGRASGPGGAAVSEGRRAAQAVKRGRLFPHRPVRTLPLNERSDFRPVIETLRREDALTESGRCLRCDILCDKCVETCPNRANAAIVFEPAAFPVPVFPGPRGLPPRPRSFAMEQGSQILHIDDFCNECGNCETFCPHRGAPHRDKPTLFSDLEMFGSSRNDGFVLTGGKGSALFRCRAGGFEFDMEVPRGRGELAFRSERFDLVFDLGGAPVLKTHRVETDGTLDTGPMVGLSLLAGAALARHPYLFEGR
jgi:ferredoxin